MTTPPSDQQLVDFVLREARLLDQQRWEDWLDLFAEDGHYWMPVEWGQTDPRLTTSLMYEDKLLLRVRERHLRREIADADPERTKELQEALEKVRAAVGELV